MLLHMSELLGFIATGSLVMMVLAAVDRYLGRGDSDA
jgi:hypothetical protein